jgi:hypothetical protein
VEISPITWLPQAQEPLPPAYKMDDFFGLDIFLRQLLTTVASNNY